MIAPPAILAYHGISDVDPRLDPDRLFVAPSRLRMHISRLLKRGYDFVKVADFAARLTAGDELRRTCALTFDDGPEDNLTELLPLLRELGVPATIYVCPELFGAQYPWCDPAAGVRFLTAEEVLELAADPLIEIGSHTMRHTELDAASFDEAYREMRRSKGALEDLLSTSVVSFAYPRCLYSPDCPQAARKAGYRSAVTCTPRGSWDAFELRRETMHTPDGPITLAFKSRGIYQQARRLPPMRAARAITRPYRHRAERSD